MNLSLKVLHIRILLPLALVSTISAFFMISLPISMADEYHYRNVLIGERGAALGGAFIAISDDPSGVFYNPAGLAFGFENYVSGSANTFNSSKTVYKSVTAGGDYTYSSQSFSPSFLGFSQSIGKNRFAFAIVLPNYDLVDQDDYVTGISSTTDSAYSLRRRFYNQDITYSAGPAYSVPLGENASIGISVMGFIRTNTLINNQLIQDNPTPNGKYYIQDSYLKQTDYGIVPKIGFQYMASPKLSLGATLKKNINITGSGQVRTLQNKSDPKTGIPSPKTGGFSDDFDTSDGTFNSAIAAPWEVGLGGAYFFSKSFLMTTDISYYSTDPRFGAFAIAATYNWAVGMEWYVTEGFALRVGTYSNRANTPQVDSSSTNQSPHVDLYGGTLGLSLIKSGSSFTLGSSYSAGIGKGQAFGNSTSTQDVSQNSLSISLAGSYQL